MACREAPALAGDLGLQQLCIALDCMNVVKHIHDSTGGCHGGVVKDIKSGSKSFSSCVFLHELRNSNYEPHSLARHALSLDQGQYVWFGQPHDPVVLTVSLNFDQ